MLRPLVNKIITGPNIINTNTIPKNRHVISMIICSRDLALKMKALLLFRIQFFFPKNALDKC